MMDVCVCVLAGRKSRTHYTQILIMPVQHIDAQTQSSAGSEIQKLILLHI